MIITTILVHKLLVYIKCTFVLKYFAYLFYINSIILLTVLPSQILIVMCTIIRSFKFLYSISYFCIFTFPVLQACWEHFSLSVLFGYYCYHWFSSRLCSNELYFGLNFYLGFSINFATFSACYLTQYYKINTIRHFSYYCKSG